jgi:tetratricopeptide (TPR) repeat protein
MQQVSSQNLSLEQALDRAVRHLNAGQALEAQSFLNEVLVQKPSHPDARHLLGVVYLMQNQYESAEKEIRKSLQKNPKFAMAHFNLGNALWGQNKPDHAVLAYKKALKLKPDYEQAERKLADALYVAEKFDEAENQYRALLEKKPTDANIMVTLGDMLHTQGKYDGAIELFERAHALHPKEVVILVKLANTLNLAHRHGEAERAILKALEINSDSHTPHMAYAYILLSQGKAQEALCAVNKALDIYPGETTAVAWKITALDQLGGGAEYDSYMNFENFVRPEMTPTPAGYKTHDEFNDALVKHVINHPKLFSFEHYEVTRHGQEVKDIFSEPMGPVEHLKAAMEKRVADYIATLPDDPDNQFVQTAPKKWRIKSWANVLKGEGRQIAHIHGEAWLSGCYYVRLPDVMKQDDNPDKSGWIEFGQINDEFPNLKTDRLKFLKPVEGLMALFPSYLYHSTVPTQSKQPRIAIAFDVVPVK